MGGPSAAIVISELADLGASTLLRVGTSGGLAPGLELGELVIATEAISDDGTSRALGVTGRAPASPVLLDALIAATGARTGPVVSTDLFYEDPRDPEREWIAAGAIAVEMEAATLFALAAKRGFEAGALLIVSDLLGSERVRIETDALRDAEHRLGQAALDALSTARKPARRRGLGRLLGLGLRRSRRWLVWRVARPLPTDFSIRSSRSSIPVRRLSREAAALSSSSRCSSRSRPSSIPSSRCETPRRRRVRRSRSLADGRFRAPIAASCARNARSRASRTRPTGHR